MVLFFFACFWCSVFFEFLKPEKKPKEAEAGHGGRANGSTAVVSSVNLKEQSHHSLFEIFESQAETPVVSEKMTLRVGSWAIIIIFHIFQGPF